MCHLILGQQIILKLSYIFYRHKRFAQLTPRQTVSIITPSQITDRLSQSKPIRNPSVSFQPSFLMIAKLDQSKHTVKHHASLKTQVPNIYSSETLAPSFNKLGNHNREHPEPTMRKGVTPTSQQKIVPEAVNTDGQNSINSPFIGKSIVNKCLNCQIRKQQTEALLKRLKQREKGLREDMFLMEKEIKSLQAEEEKKRVSEVNLLKQEHKNQEKLWQNKIHELEERLKIYKDSLPLEASQCLPLQQIQQIRKQNTLLYKKCQNLETAIVQLEHLLEDKQEALSCLLKRLEESKCRDVSEDEDVTASFTITGFMQQLRKENEPFSGNAARTATSMLMSRNTELLRYIEKMKKWKSSFLRNLQEYCRGREEEDPLRQTIMREIMEEEVVVTSLK